MWLAIVGLLAALLRCAAPVARHYPFRSVVGHCVQSHCSLGSDTKHSGAVMGGDGCCIGSWLVDKLANKMYHLLQHECLNVQVLVYE